jgi:hypothetical protein
MFKKIWNYIKIRGVLYNRHPDLHGFACGMIFFTIPVLVIKFLFW